jgi:hypothetical protein
MANIDRCEARGMVFQFETENMTLYTKCSTSIAIKLWCIAFNLNNSTIFIRFLKVCFHIGCWFCVGTTSYVNHDVAVDLNNEKWHSSVLALFFHRITTYQDFSVFVAKLNITFWKNFELIRNVIAHEGKDIDVLSILQHKTRS